jgi:hypothetical protein
MRAPERGENVRVARRPLFDALEQRHRAADVIARQQRRGEAGHRLRVRGIFAENRAEYRLGELRVAHPHMDAADPEPGLDIRRIALGRRLQQLQRPCVLASPRCRDAGGDGIGSVTDLRSAARQGENEGEDCQHDHLNSRASRARSSCGLNGFMT